MERRGLFAVNVDKYTRIRVDSHYSKIYNDISYIQKIYGKEGESMGLEMFSLAGGIALVTGVSRGLGKGIALALAGAGADIAGVYHESDYRQVEAEVTALGRAFYPVKCDLAGLHDAEPLATGVEENFGPVHILVNNAGIQRRHPAADFPVEDWDLVMQVHLRASFLLCQSFGKRMIARGEGKIINISSVNAFMGGLYIPAYAAAKGGISQMTKTLANEWAAKGVNVNAIAPGYMGTEMNTALMNDPTRAPQILERIPANRWGTPEDLGGAAIFLASKASDYMHGSVLCVDGGWLAR